MNTSLSFFDPTKAIGWRNVRRSPFPTVESLLVEMNRLGIERALAYHHEARFYHPAPGNRLLLHQIESTPAARQRVFPAAVISPVMRYDRDALPELKAAMAENRVRALRFFSNPNGTLRQIEPLLEELMPFAPVLFFDAQEQAPDATETAELAVRFPHLPLVLLQTMWPGELQLADLMERCPNLHIDNSWMHSDRTLERMCERFGADRVLFGAGPDSHNAAAIAALVHAEISDEDKALVAGGNLARLLQIEDEPARNITPFSRSREDKPLWNAYLRGEKLKVDIVDAHAHPSGGGSWLCDNVDIAAQAERALRQMDRIGISTMCMASIRALFGDAVGALEEDEALLCTFGERFRGYVVFPPFQAERVLEHVDEYFSRQHFIGFKILNAYWQVPITDARFRPMWQYADAHHLPILIHTWIDPFNDPFMLRDIAPAYPNAQFILGHSGGSDHQSALALAADNPNVYLEWCGCFCSQERWEPIIAEAGNNRVLYGSDAMAHGIDWELGRLLSLDLPDEQLVPILGANMRAVLARRH